MRQKFFRMTRGAAFVALVGALGCSNDDAEPSGNGGNSGSGGDVATGGQGVPNTGGMGVSGGADSGGAAGSSGSGGSPGIPGEGGPELNAGCTPEFELELVEEGGQAIQGNDKQLFLDAVDGDPDGTVIDIGRHVCRILYRNTPELLPITHLKLIIRHDDAIGWKSGSGSSITVMISSRHLRSVYENSGENADAVAAEVKGILYHEMTHMYQYDDRDNPKKREGDKGPEYHRLGNVIEGVADFVRYRAGYMPPGRTPDKSEAWDAGYNKAAFFLLWLDTQYPGFVYRMNQTMAGGDGMNWTPEWSFPEIADGKTQEELWAEYQSSTCCDGSNQTCCQ